MFKSLLKKSSLRTKLLVIGIALPSAIVGCQLYFYATESYQKAIDSGVDKARALCLAVESAREQTEKQWESGIFKAEHLQKWSEAGEKEKVLSTIPVVTAWNSALNKAEEGGYKFRVPAFNARNPDNLPNEMQAKAIEEIKSKDLEEYHVVDKEKNLVHYFRPVKLTQSCMACHGDPETSLAVWGNSDGVDATGYQMENWEVGQMHGAFEIVQSLDEATDAAGNTVFYAILFSLVALSASGVATLLTTRTITSRIGKGIGAISTHVGVLRNFSDTFGRQSENASQQTEAMRESVETVNENISSVSNAIDEMGCAINEIAQRSTEVSRVAESAVDEANSTKESMNRLEASCRKIDDVVGLINGLTEQTNLLALNATIEAARAGEAGKGFAVVANEVKELANETGRATGGISDFVKSIHVVSNEVMESVDRIHTTIGDINSAQHAIATAVNEQSATTQSIISNIADVQSLSAGMSDRIATINQATTETASGAESSAELVTEIESTANQFPELVGVNISQVDSDITS